MATIDYRSEFQTDAGAYEKVTQSKHIRLIYELEKQVLCRYFPRVNSHNKDLLDFACGTGRWTQFLENYFQTTTGVDISAEMLERAAQKCTQAEFVHGDITAADVDVLGDRQFDVVTAFRFYKNAEDRLREEATRAIAKHLKPGGLLIFDLHLNSFSLVGMLASLLRTFGLARVLGAGTLTVRTISLRTIRRLFQDSPFEIVDYYGTGLLPGRSNYTLLPETLLYPIESSVTQRKILRAMAYNILVVARKKAEGY